MIHFFQPTFLELDVALRRKMREAPAVRTERWQGVVANTETRELRNVCYEIPLVFEDLEHWRLDCRPNLPWADDHFLERVGGEPLNPGEQWKHWPWSNRADVFRSNSQFNHTYMERLWPKYVGRTSDGSLPLKKLEGLPRKYPARADDPRPKYGIRGYYGDLWDLVELLAKEPHTRQAWIPLFHPEDTGIGDGGRKMCSLGYQLMVRDGTLHMYYPLRSCDLVRHWRDDCYLAIRMLLWVLDRCRELDRIPLFWKSVVPGTLMMHMTSLHVFENDVVDL